MDQKVPEVASKIIFFQSGAQILPKINYLEPIKSHAKI